MKTITIDGETFNYKVDFFNDMWGEYGVTSFFKDTEKKTYKKYFLFGPLVEKEEAKVLFTVKEDIESPYFTKEEIYNKIKNKLYILKRVEEIVKGEII